MDVVAKVVVSSNKKVHLVVAKGSGEGSLKMWLDGTDLESESSLLKKNVSLCGFGVGEWKASADGLVFKVDSDCEFHSVTTADSSKHSGMLCNIMNEIEGTSGKIVKLSYHDKQQLTDVGGAPVAGRWQFTQKKQVSFIPAVVAEDKQHALTMVEIGGLYRDRYTDLPSEHASLSFDFEIIASTSDPTVTTLRPKCVKLLLKHDFVVLKGKAVMLT